MFTANGGGGSYDTGRRGSRLTRHRRRRRLRRRRQPLRDRRLSRSQRRAARRSASRSSRSRSPRRTRVTLLGTLAAPARHAGSARAHARAMGGRSAPGRSGRGPVRHAQDDQPAAGRRALDHRFDAATDAARRPATAASGEIRQYLALRRGAARRRRAASSTSTATSAASARVSAGARRRGATAAHGRPWAPTPIACRSGVAALSTTFGALGELRRDEDDTVRKHRRLSPRLEWRFAAGVRGDLGRALERGSLTSPTTIINRRQSGRQWLAPVHQHQPGAGAGLQRHPRPQSLCQLRAGLRNAHVRRDRLPASGAGLNFALDPATKPRRRDRRQGAWRERTGSMSPLFPIDTDDEIVIDAATGGRTRSRTPSKTRRAASSCCGTACCLGASTDTWR